MKKHILRFSANTISFRLIVLILAATLPLFAYLFYSSFYSIQVVRNQVAESYKKMATQYMKQIDDNLEDTDVYLSYLNALDTDLEIMDYAVQDENEYTLAKMRLYNKVKENIPKLKAVEGILVYSTAWDDSFEAYIEGIPLEERSTITAYIIEKKIMDQESLEKFHSWKIEKIGERYYLLRLLKMDNIYIASIVSTDELIAPYNENDAGQKGISLFVDGAGTPLMQQQLIADDRIALEVDPQKYTISGVKVKYLIVGEKSAKGDFSLISLIPESTILENLPFLKRGIIILSVAFLILLPLVLILLDRVVLVPLRKMRSAMRRVEEGDLETRIEPYSASGELESVNSAFNTMIDRINKLKIDIYEEKISRQNAELRHLELQINPHFFLNSLNIIYTLARSGSYEAIQEMTMSLIRYFRFMFRSNLSVVSLKDELEHVKNYVHIQELRFPDSLVFEADVPDFLLGTPIPPLLIHTFVENAVKHAASRDNVLKLFVAAEWVELSGAQRMKIQIRDTGKGYSPEVLDKLRNGERIIDGEREHIGIRNVQQRLQLMYQGRAAISFGNDPGAFIEIVLPLDENHTGGEGSDAESADRR